MSLAVGGEKIYDKLECIQWSMPWEVVKFWPIRVWKAEHRPTVSVAPRKWREESWTCVGYTCTVLDLSNILIKHFQKEIRSGKNWLFSKMKIVVIMFLKWMNWIKWKKFYSFNLKRGLNTLFLKAMLDCHLSPFSTTRGLGITTLWCCGIIWQ